MPKPMIGESLLTSSSTCSQMLSSPRRGLGLALPTFVGIEDAGDVLGELVDRDVSIAEELDLDIKDDADCGKEHEHADHHHHQLDPTLAEKEHQGRPSEPHSTPARRGSGGR